MNGWDQSTVLCIVLYFLYWSKDWFPLFLFMTVLGTVSHIFMLVATPESPKWLLTQNRRPEAIAALNRIARFNRSKNSIPEDATFEELYYFKNDDPNVSSVTAISQLNDLARPAIKDELRTLVKLVVIGSSVLCA